MSLRPPVFRLLMLVAAALFLAVALTMRRCRPVESPSASAGWSSARS